MFKEIFKMNNFLSKRLNRFIFSILSGCLLFLSFPYTGSLTFLIFISLVPLLLLEDHISKFLKGKNLFLHSYLTFLIYNLGTTWWIWNASEEGMLFAVLLNSLLMSLFFQCFHVLKKVFNNISGMFFLIVTWISFEHFHYSWELSWPWLNLGNVFSITPKFIQWYEYTGILGGTLWILGMNYFIFYLLRKVMIRQVLSKLKLTFLAVMLLLPCVFSFYVYTTYNEYHESVNVLCLQPNIDPYNEKFNTTVESQLNKLISLSENKISDSIDLVVAPETAISASVWENNFSSSSICHLFQGISKEKDVPILIGASTLKFFPVKKSNVSRKLNNQDGFYESYNSSVLFDSNILPVFIHKSKLVLGVEKIPFNTMFPWLEDLAIDLDGASGSLGTENKAKSFKSKGLSFTSTVCYESIYGEFVAEQVKSGAQFICIITNDGWWGNTPGYKQHASFASLRAIENRRAVVRSANTGISSFINQKGDVISKTKWWVEDTLTESISKNKKITFYTKYGDVLGSVSEVLLYGLVLTLLFVKVKKAIKK